MKASTVDWCESNYAVLPFIAEFWNSSSSLILFYAGYKGFTDHSGLNGNIIFAILALVGLGSVAFHSVLTVETQMLDEVPMVFLLAQLCLNAFNVKDILITGLVYTHATFYSYQIYSTAHTDTLMNVKVERAEFYLFQLSVFITAVALFITYLLTEKSKVESQLFKRGVGIFLFGWSCWLSDYFLCDIFQSFNLHAWWHLFSAISVHQLSVLSIIKMNKDKAFDLQDGILPCLKVHEEQDDSDVSEEFSDSVSEDTESDIDMDEMDADIDHAYNFMLGTGAKRMYRENFHDSDVD